MGLLNRNSDGFCIVFYLEAVLIDTLIKWILMPVRKFIGGLSEILFSFCDVEVTVSYLQKISVSFSVFNIPFSQFSVTLSVYLLAWFFSSNFFYQIFQY